MQVITPPDSANRVISQLVDQYASQTGALLARAKEVLLFCADFAPYPTAHL